MNSITGRLYKKSRSEEKISKKGDTFYTRDFIVEVEGRYTDYIPFELYGESCSMIDNFEVGDVITVNYYLKGNLWKEKAILRLSPSTVTLSMPNRTQSDNTRSKVDDHFDIPTQTSTVDYTESNESDDLPF